MHTFKERCCKLVKGNRKYYFILFGVVLIMLHSYFNGITSYPEGDDTTFHVANITAVESLMDFSKGEFFPGPILPGIANDFGYGVGIFYPRLPHFIAAFITHVLSPIGVTPAIALKLCHIVILFLSGLIVFKFVYKLWKNDKVAFFSAFFYITSSYMVSDIITRDAFAECFQFLFLPMILLGLYELFYGKKKQFYFYFVLGYLGMIHTHLVMTLFLTMVPVIFLLFHFKETFRWKNLKHLLLASTVILLISLPSIIPLLEHKMLGDYVIFSENGITSTGLVQASRLSFLSYFIPFWDNKHIQPFILIPVIILLVLALSKRKEIFKGKEKIGTFFLSTLIFFVIFSSKLIPWKWFPDALLMIQFPWRLLLIITLFISILAASYFIVKKIPLKKEKQLIILIIILAMIPTFPLNGHLSKEQLEAKNIYEKGMGWSREYLPIETGENWKNQKKITDIPTLKVVDGNGSFENVKNKIPNFTFDVITESPITIEIPRLYYLGYNIVWENGSEKKNISYEKSENGYVLCEVPGTGKIQMTYTGTKITIITQYISTITLVGSVAAFIFLTRRNNNLKTKAIN